MKSLKSLIVVLALMVLAASWMPARVASSRAAGPEAVSNLADSLNIEYVGHTGGEITTVTLQGNFAFVNEGLSITILDISVPGSVGAVGRSYLFPSSIGGIAASGDYAYVSGGGFGLRVLDVSDPTNPTEIGEYNPPGGSGSVAVQGGYVYLAESSGLRILDISDPTNPTAVGFYAPPSGYIYKVTVAGNYTYLTLGVVVASVIQVVDISDPTNPQGLGAYNSPSSVRGVTVVGDYAYVAAFDSGLRVVDVSNPNNPVEIGVYDTPGDANAVAVQGSYAYVGETNDYHGMRVVDVSAPANPIGMGFYPSTGEPNCIAVTGDFAYVAGSTSGLRVVDVSDPDNPIETDFYYPPAQASDVKVDGDYAYVADGGSGLLVIDILDPPAPFVVGVSGPLGVAVSVAVEGSYTYVADLGIYADPGLHIFDITNPTNPSEVGFFITPGQAEDVAVAGDYAYMTDLQNGLRVVDISDPTSPEEVGFLAVQDPGRIAVSGNYAYLTKGIYGDIQVVDVSNPTQPAVVGNFSTSNFAADVAVAGDYAYVANGEAGLRVVDVTNPISPTEVGFYDTPGNAVSLAVEGSYAYMAEGEGGVRMIDISNPANPFEVGYYDTPDYAAGVWVASDLIYVADQAAGLIILRYTVEPITTTTSILSDTPDPSWASQPFTVTFGVTATMGIPTGVVSVTVSEGEETCSGELVDGLGSCQIALSTPGTYTLNANYTGEENFLPSSASELHTVDLRRIHLPLVIKSPEVIPGLTGKVTENGVPVAGIPLDLRFYDGTSYSTYASTATDAEGNYLFSQVPALQSGQNYYVRYRNEADIDSRLAYWHTADNVTYNGATLDTFATFDIANIFLATPDPEARVNLPVTFTWIPRPASPTDSYEFELFDPANADTYFYTDPPLGYVSSYTLQGLPDGFEEETEYGWAINVLSPEGGFGGSYYYYPITFE